MLEIDVAFMIRLNPTWGSTNKSNTVLNLAIGFAYIVLVNIFLSVFHTLYAEDIV